MSGRTTGLGTPDSRNPAWSWPGDGILACARGLAFCGLMVAGAGPVLAVLFVLRFVVSDAHPTHTQNVKLGFLLVLIVGSLLATRPLANLTRRLAGQWCGVPIAVPYRPRPAVVSGGDGLRVRFPAWLEWLLSDPATGRDLLWTALNTCGGWIVAALPAALVGYGLGFMVAPVLGFPIARTPYLGSLTPGLAIPLGLAVAALGLRAAPLLLRAYGACASSLLAPTGQAELSARVRHLAQTRSETIDTGAAEMRRIERDLHDGAQARLVAMGMTLDAAEQLIDTSPAAARSLLAEARDASVQALSELRDLVRGIHPPVLADRGLADAVRALALDSPFRSQVIGGLRGRPPAPVESAAYFAVSELLANVAKHAGPAQVWIDIRHERGMLAIGVTDDGRGGADPGRGTGLRGIERRVAAFDGVLAVASPPGGPTVVNLEIPCALSLPKTSSC
jgi:signal transduction histidine kinase